MGWHADPLVPVPLRFKGLDPHKPEPWSADAKRWATHDVPFSRVYCREEPGRHHAASLGPLAAGGAATDRPGMGAHGPLGGLHARPPPTWDASPMRATPHALKGMQLLSYHREPWCRDEALYNADTTRVSGDSQRSVIGSTSHRARARNRQVERPSFYAPAWDWWASLLSA